MTRFALFAVCALQLSIVAGYQVVRDYSGQNFFTGWDFYGNYDNLTLGNAVYLNQSEATKQNLAYINSEGRAIIKVDNTTDVAMGQNRSSIRMTSQDAYPIGSLWIIDLYHIPYGCSVWPAFWTFGPNWPNDGEIDIIEAINIMGNNQMVLHTTPGCTHSSTYNQLGANIGSDCSTPSGCVVAETQPNSYNSGFAAAGGGVWATQFDVTGVFIWFWSRPNVPESITQANSTSSIDITSWGTPSASYFANTCNITEFFSPQNLVFDITLCGDWAGTGYAYNATCGSSGPTGLCYNDCVVGPGSPRYDEAYFDISYVRAYTTEQPAPTTTTTSTSIPTSTTSTTNRQTSSSGAISTRNDSSRGLILLATVAVGIILGARFAL
ncbi:glycoside hydrolase family 16 protein [Serpula lacrymans var. lacrymans S7.3]|uniref:Glycoside hydrolase family 16 protein n=2 Tax=Serpula lacrymans var. lacrymans TaxID=341189 RepID=F8PK94_SERL3|nr:glycoside hydrolase family 16 protein [Serpula lacrymans var. lacrymans S7.9]EGO03548.1 glycoside hydrolase family 16 protein [Serpula lacrymans var. lacrymans S7.3]EGO29357.1 glycoside hydrolase family 16 protein [Serpula lacrymans var. lacrymans S7.9]